MVLPLGDLASRMYGFLEKNHHKKSVRQLLTSLDNASVHKADMIKMSDAEPLHEKTEGAGPKCWELCFCIHERSGQLLYAMCASWKLTVLGRRFPQKSPQRMILNEAYVVVRLEGIGQADDDFREQTVYFHLAHQYWNPLEPAFVGFEDVDVLDEGDAISGKMSHGGYCLFEMLRTCDPTMAWDAKLFALDDGPSPMSVFDPQRVMARAMTDMDELRFWPIPKKLRSSLRKRGKKRPPPPLGPGNPEHDAPDFDDIPLSDLERELFDHQQEEEPSSEGEKDPDSGDGRGKDLGPGLGDPGPFEFCPDDEERHLFCPSSSVSDDGVSHVNSDSSGARSDGGGRRIIVDPPHNDPKPPIEDDDDARLLVDLGNRGRGGRGEGRGRANERGRGGRGRGKGRGDHVVEPPAPPHPVPDHKEKGPPEADTFDWGRWSLSKFPTGPGKWSFGARCGQHRDLDGKIKEPCNQSLAIGPAMTEKEARCRMQQWLLAGADMPDSTPDKPQQRHDHVWMNVHRWPLRDEEELDREASTYVVGS